MGVPKFYRWISERYPCLSQVIKDYQVSNNWRLFLALLFMAKLSLRVSIVLDEYYLFVAIEQVFVCLKWREHVK